MTDTWQNGAIPPPPNMPPPGYPAAATAAGAVNPFLASSAAGRGGPSRATLLALAGVGVVAATGAWFAFGHSGSKPPAVASPPTVASATAQAPSGPPVVDKIPAAPTSGLDLGAAPKLADVVPEIEQFVEQARGHRFKHHVPVTPLGDKAFVKALRRADGPAGAGTDAYTSVKALHLVPAGLDTSGPVPDSAYASIVGFYDFRTKKLYVRGTTLNPLTQSVVAHELTHALDDQYFALSKVQHLGRNSDQSEAILSLIEGDARSVENRFSKALTPQRQHQEDAERAAYFQHMTAQASDVADPFVLELFSVFPYELGSIFVDALNNEGGPTAVDAAFAAPPASTLDILDPEGRYLKHVKTLRVAAPAAAGKVIDHDTLGPLGLASVLSEGNPIDWSREDVVEGWRGDSYVTVRTGAQACVHDSIRTATPAANAALAKTLRAWASRHQGASIATTSKTGLLLVSCAG